MASNNTSMSLVKRQASSDVALMPPPPLKRIKRPAKVLDEDEYTSALSGIIARDYFPGLRETQAQKEYLAALESDNDAWIVQAGSKLREAMTPMRHGKGTRAARNTRFNAQRGVGGETPRGYTGSETPFSVAESVVGESPPESSAVDTTTLSLSAFQAKYTSEDNESFYSLLDKQNQKKREKHAYMWSGDQRIPSARQIAYRERERRLLKEKAEEETKTGKELIPITHGATDSRPAKPDSWKIKKPNNTFMFPADSIDDDGLETVQDVREAASKLGPKQTVHANTRFQPQYMNDNLNNNSTIPPSPSLNTDIITRREANKPTTPSETEYPGGGDGGETPRVNGYAFVDEDEPDLSNNPPTQLDSGPSYRDLLAGQVLDTHPNPFSISDNRRREALHHRMVEDTSRKKRTKDRETQRGDSSVIPGTATPGGVGMGAAGNMTPAARKLMEKIGRTPVAGRDRGVNIAAAGGGGKEGRLKAQDMWTPLRTPRRKVVNANVVMK